jgi:hypothetical protein
MSACEPHDRQKNHIGKYKHEHQVISCLLKEQLFYESDVEVERFLEDNGMIPMKGHQIRRSKKSVKAGHINYVVKVDQIAYNKKGELIKGYKFPENNNVAIVQIDPKKTMSFVRKPEKRYARDRDTSSAKQSGKPQQVP